MNRVAALAYGTVCYAIFFASFLYAIGFVGGFIVPTTLDGAPTAPLLTAVGINLTLLSIFAVQHSVMARPAFKRLWTRIVPEHLERSTYVLFSSLALIAVFAHWEPMGGTVWQIESTTGQAIAYTLFAFGWGLVLYATFLINHFDLFGLRQVWLYFRGKNYTPLTFRVPGAYKLVRHPLYVGWFFAFWATPNMTAAHFFFAAVCSAYILVAIQLEERDLIDSLGKDYEDYRKRVPSLIPGLKRKSASKLATAA